MGRAQEATVLVAIAERDKHENVQSCLQELSLNFWWWWLQPIICGIGGWDMTSQLW